MSKCHGQFRFDQQRPCPWHNALLASQRLDRQIMHCRQSYLKRYGRRHDEETISEEICATCSLPSGMRLGRSSHSPTCCGKPKSEQLIDVRTMQRSRAIPNSIMTSLVTRSVRSASSTSTFPRSAGCAKTGGESSYTELITCMEMARDVRKLHSEADNSTGSIPEELPAPVDHRQPTR